MSTYAVDALAGRTALVTGGSRGIGEASARALDAAGARVILSGRDEARLEAIAKELNDPVVLPSDLAVPGAGGELARRALDAGGQVDVLVNCAGVARPAAKLGEEENLDALLAVNLRGPFMVAGILAKAMAKRGQGSIVSLSSVASSRGISPSVDYAATKGAIDAMTRTLAFRYGPRGVRVNAVAPGYVDTEFSGGAGQIPGFEAAVAGETALGRVGHADDIADVVVFLASDAARYVTGQVIDVDGGFTMTKAVVRMGS
ncbi:SDR family oxidoreductase [Frankia sp. Cr2]|uniref:SDR family NAD(P)-dependent oxidoreductase n=1 Tax=Frankia sp. Cr2 TaxID=3073932 RepID=UPI002AD3CFF1|nr:SDR family oxidoreductase [Frankia sp. Cr2]